MLQIVSPIIHFSANNHATWQESQIIHTTLSSFPSLACKLLTRRVLCQSRCFRVKQNRGGLCLCVKIETGMGTARPRPWMRSGPQAPLTRVVSRGEPDGVASLGLQWSRVAAFVSWCVPCHSTCLLTLLPWPQARCGRIPRGRVKQVVCTCGRHFSASHQPRDLTDIMKNINSFSTTGYFKKCTHFPFCRTRRHQVRHFTVCPGTPAWPGDFSVQRRHGEGGWDALDGLIMAMCS